MIEENKNSIVSSNDEPQNINKNVKQFSVKFKDDKKPNNVKKEFK